MKELVLMIIALILSLCLTVFVEISNSLKEIAKNQIKVERQIEY